ncbi:MAG: aminoacyl-tRNA deacylase [Candidatus Moraniibacteriota bacterium]|nr:MAG: aminoacyl-tRNA deacylase [Candidatus Moranbacteria bacterium]
MEERLYTVLDALGIQYEKYEHPAFASCDASGDYYQNHDMGVDCRNSFMRNRRGKKHYLVVMKKEKKIDIPHLAAFLGENKKMGFASKERLEKYLGLTPGSVTPFGILHENACDIPLVIDNDIFDHEYVHYHPLRNTASLKITTKDFKKFLDMINRKVFYYEVK